MKSYKRDKILQNIYTTINNYDKQLLSALITFIIPLGAIFFDNIVDGVEINEFFNSLQFVVFLIAIILYGIIVLTKIFLKIYLNSDKMKKEIEEISKQYLNPVFDNIQGGGIGWDWDKNYVDYKDIEKGLKTKQVIFERKNQTYNFNELKKMDKSLAKRDLNKEYQKYLNNAYFNYFSTDSTRLMVYEKPEYDSENKKITIKFKNTKWSQLRFFWDHIMSKQAILGIKRVENKKYKDNNSVLKNLCNKIKTTKYKYLSTQNYKTKKRKKYVKYCFENSKIQVPNTLSLHLVILTEDDKILMVQNSPNKFTDFPSHWTVSISENIDEVDFKNIDNPSYKLVKRALKEELSLTGDDFDKNDIKYLSLNCEGNVCNFTYSCIIKINRTSKELETFLKEAQRMDNEFNRIDFINVEDIPKELVKPSRSYHPTSQIRMLYAYWHLRGLAGVKFAHFSNIEGNKV